MTALRHMFGLLVCSLAIGAAAAAEKPNVLFIAVDDMRVELGCYGDTLVQSPHIDRLASRGVRFERAYCQQAVCNPSRASLMTGLRPTTLGISNLETHFREVRPDIVTLPQLFKQNGYFAQNIGKIYHNWRQDDYEGDPLSWSVPAVMHYANHGADTPQVDPLPPALINLPRAQMYDVPDNAYFDGRIAELAVNALESMGEKPFFLAVGFWKPHAPFNAPKKYWDMYSRGDIAPPSPSTPPENVPDLAMHDSREIRRGFKNRPNGRPTAEEALALRHGYYAAISYVDAQIGKVLTALEKSGHADDTVIVFWSDHGYHLGEKTLWAKTSNFELDAHVPVIISAPGMRQGESTASLAELLDLYPTVAELAGLTPPHQIDGVSLAAVLADPTATPRRAAFTTHPRPAYVKLGEKPTAMGYSVRTDRFRFTQWRDHDSGKLLAEELYQHDIDHDESSNVVEKPEHRATLRDHRAILSKEFGSFERQ